MNRIIMPTITLVLALVGSILPAQARNCSFGVCLNECSKMPDDPASTYGHGPKNQCLASCNSCSRPVVGGSAPTAKSPSGSNPNRHPTTGTQPVTSGTLKGPSGGTSTAPQHHQ
jgi:hypothetical protein